jgi:acyl dehydratase
MTEDLLHYEDFPVGEMATFGPRTVTREEIIAFAREFDAQPFHLDEAAARASLLGGLCASGWHVCALMNRISIDGYIGRSASLGSFGIREMRWIRPVLPGDELCVRRTTLEKRVSEKRPYMGIITFRWEGMVGEVMKAEMVGIGLVRVRGAA